MFVHDVVLVQCKKKITKFGCVLDKASPPLKRKIYFTVAIYDLVHDVETVFNHHGQPILYKSNCIYMSEGLQFSGDH